MDSIHNRSSERGMIFTKWWGAVSARITNNVKRRKKISSDDVLCGPIERTRSQPDLAMTRNVAVVRRQSKSIDLVRPSDDVLCGPIERTRSQPDLAMTRNVAVVRRQSKSIDLVRPSDDTYPILEEKALDIVIPCQRFTSMLSKWRDYESDDTNTCLDMCRDSDFNTGTAY